MLCLKYHLSLHINLNYIIIKYMIESYILELKVQSL